jgi:hypothetical protein
MVLVVKVAHFFIERLAEPISHRLETYAAGRATFRSACFQLATWHSRMEYEKLARRQAWEQSRQTSMAARARREESPPPELDEKEATQLGCELLGEGFVWGVGLALLAHDIIRDRNDEVANEKKVEQNEARIAALEEAQQVLLSQVASMQRDLQRKKLN